MNELDFLKNTNTPKTPETGKDQESIPEKAAIVEPVISAEEKAQISREDQDHIAQLREKLGILEKPNWDEMSAEEALKAYEDIRDAFFKSVSGDQAQIDLKAELAKLADDPHSGLSKQEIQMLNKAAKALEDVRVEASSDQNEATLYLRDFFRDSDSPAAGHVEASRRENFYGSAAAFAMIHEYKMMTKAGQQNTPFNEQLSKFADLMEAYARTHIEGVHFSDHLEKISRHEDTQGELVLSDSPSEAMEEKAKNIRKNLERIWEDMKKLQKIL